jgi:hypothetical protein
MTTDVLVAARRALRSGRKAYRSGKFDDLDGAELKGWVRQKYATEIERDLWLFGQCGN